MIKLVLRNSEEVKWTNDQYDDYVYDGRFFILKNKNMIVGMYNLEFVISIIIK